MVPSPENSIKLFSMDVNVCGCLQLFSISTQCKSVDNQSGSIRKFQSE